MAKKIDIPVGQVKIAELRKGLKSLLDLKTPHVVLRNSRPVGILLSVETSWFGRLDHPVVQSRRIRAELDAVLRKLVRNFLVD
jgi:hypothetical protein